MTGADQDKERGGRRGRGASLLKVAMTLALPQNQEANPCETRHVGIGLPLSRMALLTRDDVLAVGREEPAGHRTLVARKHLPPYMSRRLVNTTSTAFPPSTLEKWRSSEILIQRPLPSHIMVSFSSPPDCLSHLTRDSIDPPTTTYLDAVAGAGEPHPDGGVSGPRQEDVT